MRLIKGLFILVLSFGIAPHLNVDNVSAAWTNGGEDVIDNDNNRLNSGDNFYVPTNAWVHEGSGYSFRGDHRILKAPVAGVLSIYGWRFPSRSGLYGNISVYLWDSRFNNENASYRMYYYPSSGSLIQTFNKYVNQRTARGGWNDIGKTNSAKKVGNIELVVPQSASGGTGADGMKVRYSTY